VLGRIEFPNKVIEDFVVLRSDGQPTYHLSVVVDDIDMQITHVVRGDDHISNTPKHVLLFQAFGGALPAFAHVPLILGTDKKRLSKRHGATSVTEYQRLGYLSEAMVNFLALLGWSPGGDQEVFTRDELIAKFALDGISGGNAVFNPEKLDWMNQQHIQRLPMQELIQRLQPSLEAAGLWSNDYLDGRREWFARVVDLYKSRLRKLDQFAPEAQPVLVETDEVDFDTVAVNKHLTKVIADPLDELANRYESLAEFAAPTLESDLRQLADSRGIKAAALIHASRVAVTGRASSPGLFEMLELVGRTRVIARLRRAASLAAQSA
jgi:glutamyl-tRNA synthetase